MRPPSVDRAPDIEAAVQARDMARVHALLMDDARSNLVVESPEAVAEQLSNVLTPEVDNGTILLYSVPGMSYAAPVR